MKYVLTAALLAFSTPVMAEDMMKPSPMSVSETIDGLVAAVEGAGATVFARVDHTAGAASVDKSIPDAQLLIFGNPALGTLAMEEDLRAGLVLPLRVLAYADADGNTQMRWTPAEDMFAGLDVSDDVIAKVNGALNGLTDKALGAN
ncbi:Uncharacterized conserved protein, DUF302 family [Cognatiyoonia koreensis]|uniref:Uncharacterized conserved protein, DUF302 family n=1 Tax=Cognatiyoonia koreensis TaxID=364200 RepID=A0A1I0Q523_9RHOB|nr:DUF302 domain-containing protein [Cognatiyoonia koreensis]SEW21878.1 Uncharacterized conserved protein, DUF302 family [Cognatiyoonia koreensis]